MSPEILPGVLAPTVAEAGPGPPPRPKLRRSERVPDPGRWATVIPPLLAEQVADSEQLAAHRALAERVDAAAAKLAEARAAHEQTLAKDREAEGAFAQGRRAKLPAPTAPAAAEAVEHAERELELLTRQLPKSADAVFEAAHHAAASGKRLGRKAVAARGVAPRGWSSVLSTSAASALHGKQKRACYLDFGAGAARPTIRRLPGAQGCNACAARTERVGRAG